MRKQDKPIAVVVDDDAGLLTILRLNLERFGWIVHTADNGADAFKILTSLSVDLLITDIIMPNVNGLDLVRSARRVIPQLPVVLTSGDVEGHDLDPLTPISLLQKPFTRVQLEEAIDRSLKPGLQNGLWRHRFTA
jgi:two-component SAPR family response regulator